MHGVLIHWSVDKMLGYLEVVHVLVRGPHSSGLALSEIGEGHQDHQAVGYLRCKERDDEIGTDVPHHQCGCSRVGVT